MVSVDACKDKKRNPLIRAIAPSVDYYFANRTEAIQATSTPENAVVSAFDACRRLLDMGIRKAVIIKLGENGAIVGDQATGKLAHVASFLVPTTNENSAGNVFCAAVLHHVVREVPLLDAVAAANAMAAWHVMLERGLIESPEFTGWEQVYQFPRSPTLVSEEPFKGPISDKDELQAHSVSQVFDRCRSLNDRQRAEWVFRLENECGVPREASILDVGCGTGRFTEAMLLRSAPMKLPASTTT